MRFRSLFIGLQEHREPIIGAVMLVLMLLSAFTIPAFPVDDAPSEANGVWESDSWGTILVVVPFIPSTHLQALAYGPTAAIRVREHLRSRAGGRRFSVRMFSSAWGTISSVLPFISQRLNLRLTSGFIDTIHLPEYLSSHIGEKRFADGAPGSPLFELFFGCLVTAFSVTPSFLLSRRPQWNFHGR